MIHYTFLCEVSGNSTVLFVSPPTWIPIRLNFKIQYAFWYEVLGNTVILVVTLFKHKFKLKFFDNDFSPVF